MEVQESELEKPVYEKRITFAIYLSIFLGSSILFFTEPFEGYFHYLIYLMLLPFFVGRFGMPQISFKLLLIPIFVGIFQIMLGNNEAFLFIKITGGMLLSVSFYYYVVMYFDLNTKLMFEIFLKWSYWTAIVALIQFVSYKINFKLGYDYGWLLNKGGHNIGDGGIRVNSFLLEPSQLGIFLAPAAFISLINIFQRKKIIYKSYQNYVILAAIYVSRSSTGYLGIFLCVLLLAINYGYFAYFVFITIGGYFLGLGLYNSVDEFKLRVDTSLSLWVDQDFSYKNINTSSFVLYNNAHIAWENFKEHPLFGTGLGSHPVAYEQYSFTKSIVNVKGIEFNKKDANSMFLRLMSETGLLGVGFILFIIFSGYVGFDGSDRQHWTISGAMLVVILLYLLRQGNYFLNGFPFLVWLYYYNKISYLEEINAENSKHGRKS